MIRRTVAQNPEESATRKIGSTSNAELSPRSPLRMTRTKLRGRDEDGFVLRDHDGVLIVCG